MHVRFCCFDFRDSAGGILQGQLNIAVIGAGLIGRQHLKLVASNPSCSLAALVDPAAEAAEIAKSYRVPWFADLEQMLAALQPDGAIVATPTALHFEHGSKLLDLGIPVLIEKPIAHDVKAAEQLVEASERTDVPLLVGHHRRHSCAMQRARAVIEEGTLGRLVSFNALSWFLKPADYFQVPWRRTVGGGPVLINAIHTIDDMRTLTGADIIAVQAMLSSATRGFEVEDSATVLLEFTNGVLGTINLSDSVPSPWNWEMTSAENTSYPHTAEACYLIGGTTASLSVPDLKLWRHAQPSWMSQITSASLERPIEDPLARQLRHFLMVVRREVTPLVTGRDAIATLASTLAIGEAAKIGGRIRVQ